MNPDAWYANAVAWGVANNVITGYTNGKFEPDDPVTREQQAVILYVTAASGDIGGFPDSSKVYDVDPIQMGNRQRLAYG